MCLWRLNNRRSLHRMSDGVISARRSLNREPQADARETFFAAAQVSPRWQRGFSGADGMKWEQLNTSVCRFQSCVKSTYVGWDFFFSVNVETILMIDSFFGGGGVLFDRLNKEKKRTHDASLRFYLSPTALWHLKPAVWFSVWHSKVKTCQALWCYIFLSFTSLFKRTKLRSSASAAKNVLPRRVAFRSC